MTKPSISKKAIAVILVLVIAVASVFASPLTPRKGFGDAKVYDENYKAIPDAKTVSDGYVIKTGANSVVLDNGSTHVEIDADSLAIFLSLDTNVKLYILDGRMMVSSSAGDFTVMTTVTTYTAKSGSSIYVITNPTFEKGYITDGNAQVQNYITGALTILTKDRFIDNSISEFAPESTTTVKFWGSLAPEAEPVVAVVTTAIEVPSPLTTTFTYAGYKATLTAFKGYAVLTYPSFVTNEEIEAAAKAAVAAYPQYMDGIYYQITEPGKVTLSYPESYGENEFNLAKNLLDAELPAYIAALFATQQPQEEPTQTQVASTQLGQTAAEPEVKTPLETVPRPQEQEAESEAKSDLTFGLWAGVLYGAGQDGDTFLKFPYTNGRVGTFYKDFLVLVRPYVKYKSFTFGLDLDARFKDLKLDTDFYKFDTDHGVFGIINSVTRYISAIGFEGENFGLIAKINSDFSSSSPVFNGYDWRYDWKQRLVTNMYVKAGAFSITAFLDDLKFSNKLEKRGEYAGFRTGVDFNGLKAGLSLIADIGPETVKDFSYFPSVDLTIPFSISDTKFNFVANGAAKISIDDKFYLDGYIGQGVIEIGYGPVYVGFGGSYNHGSHFSDLITNAPITTVGFSDGTSFDVIFKAKLDTKVFDLDASARVPVRFDGGLVENVIKTKSGELRIMSADAFDIQAQLALGGFTFIIGGSSYGFSGKVKTVFSSIGDSEQLKNALKDIISPDTAAFFTEFDFKANIGSGILDVFVRGDVSEIEDEIRIPVSLGVSYKF